MKTNTIVIRSGTWWEVITCLKPRQKLTLGRKSSNGLTFARHMTDWRVSWYAVEKFRIRLRAIFATTLGMRVARKYVRDRSIVTVNCCRDPEITYKRRDPELARSAIASDSIHVVVERHARTSRLMTDHFYERYAVSTSTPRCRRISFEIVG